MLDWQMANILSSRTPENKFYCNKIGTGFSYET